MRAPRTLGNPRSSPGFALGALAAVSLCVASACRASATSSADHARAGHARAGPSEHLEARGALGPYSAAVVAGELVFVSGKIGPRPRGASSDAFEAEVDGAFDALESDLARLGLDLGDVVSATVYLTDMARYAELNAVYARRMKPPYPARACVAVAGLPGGARVEIAVVARRR